MNSNQSTPSSWNQISDKAISLGIISTKTTTEESTPWSTIILTFIGALISGILFIVAFCLLFYLIGVLESSIPFYVCGALLIGLSITYFRRVQNRPLFLENLLFIALMVGITFIAVGITFSYFLVNKYFNGNNLFFVVGLVVGILVLASSLTLPMSWARNIGGFVAACTFYIALYNGYSMFYFRHIFYARELLLPVSSFLFLLALNYFERTGRWKTLSLLEPMITGWLVVTLCILAVNSGQAIFFSAFIPFGGGGFESPKVVIGPLISNSLKSIYVWLLVMSLPLVFIWARRKIEVLTTIRALLLLIVISCFSFALPKLSLCLALTLAIYAYGYKKIAVLGCLCALWIIGSFYYLLSISLIEKSIWLSLLGGALIILGWIGDLRQSEYFEQSKEVEGGNTTKNSWVIHPRTTTILLLFAATVIFGGVNTSILKQEAKRSQGVKVLISLAPVDPRSIMQGDYMALNFRVPTPEHNDGIIYFLMDVARIATLSAKKPLSANYFSLKLIKKKGRWIMPADAWFFKEGMSDVWAPARYGIFTINKQGDASLIGMADKNGEEIHPQ